MLDLAAKQLDEKEFKESMGIKTLGAQCDAGGRRSRTASLDRR